jgi:hypothetical protein
VDRADVLSSAEVLPWPCFRSNLLVLRKCDKLAIVYLMFSLGVHAVILVKSVLRAEEMKQQETRYRVRNLQLSLHDTNKR